MKTEIKTVLVDEIVKIAVLGATERLSKHDMFNEIMTTLIFAACWFSVTNYDNPNRKKLFMKAVEELYDYAVDNPNAKEVAPLQ